MTLTRRALLAGGAGALLVTPRTLAAVSQGGPPTFLLDVEAAQVALYARARALPLTGMPAELAGRFHHHEAEHLRLLSKAFATPAPRAPKFAFKTEDAFLRLAQRLEGLAVSAYNGAIPAIRDPGLRAELGAIAQTEGRHAGAIRLLRLKPAAPRAFEPGAPGDRAQAALSALAP